MPKLIIAGIALAAYLLVGTSPLQSVLLALSGMVVVVSVFVHGASATPFSSWYAQG